MKRRKRNRQGIELIELYEYITCLEKQYKELDTKELEILGSKMYNAVVQELNPKRKVLLNEMLDCEVELRVRNRE